MRIIFALTTRVLGLYLPLAHGMVSVTIEK